MRYIAVTVCLLVFIATAVEGFSWKPYSGTVPSDAVEGGTDSSGNITYIGQINVTGSLDIVSVIIYQNDPYVYAAYNGKVYKTNTSVKILCADVTERIVWDVVVNKDCALIRGSYTNPYDNFYIGRAIVNGLIYTGRFSTTANTLFIPIKESPNTLTQSKTFARLAVCNY